MSILRTCLVPSVVVLAAGGAGATEYGRFAVREATTTPKPAALAMMREVTPEVPRELLPVTLEWPAAETDGARVDLTVSPYASFDAHGTIVTILADVSGTVTSPTGRCRFEQAHFGQCTAQARYDAEGSSLTLLLPVRFEPAEGAAVHALMLVPCAVAGTALRCQAPRLAFSELVQKFFPEQRSPAAVVPGVRPGEVRNTRN